jgi:hypothetical protein
MSSCDNGAQLTGAIRLPEHAAFRIMRTPGGFGPLWAASARVTRAGAPPGEQGRLRIRSFPGHHDPMHLQQRFISPRPLPGRAGFLLRA